LSPLLRFRPGSSVEFRCHFFGEDEIEFDISPEQVISQPQLDEVAIVLRSVGRSLHRDVLITHENSQGAVILRYDAADDLVKLREEPVR
jgi:hypothetical protein